MAENSVTRKNVDQLRVILVSHASGDEQVRAAVHYLDTIRSESLTYQERAICGAIYDGLAYGNWPWLKFTTQR